MKKSILTVLTFLALTTGAWSQSSPLKYLSLSSDNATLVLAGPVTLSALAPINTTTTLYYLKLFDKVTAPVCGTDVPKWTVPVPYGASNSGGGVALPTGGLLFSSGFGFCLVGGIADTDDSSAAPGVAINFGISKGFGSP